MAVALFIILAMWYAEWIAANAHSGLIRDVSAGGAERKAKGVELLVLLMAQPRPLKTGQPLCLQPGLQSRMFMVRN
ncbi:hypothetical protein F5X96DRAFT_668633 [Biscogniauxia mediterranea]|nr:hypothetical protein F5X96DRAFT_668633 [Biscogniauxia mediterranea]